MSTQIWLVFFHLWFSYSAFNDICVLIMILQQRSSWKMLSLPNTKMTINQFIVRRYNLWGSIISIIISFHWSQKCTCGTNSGVFLALDAQRSCPLTFNYFLVPIILPLAKGIKNLLRLWFAIFCKGGLLLLMFSCLCHFNYLWCSFGCGIAQWAIYIISNLLCLQVQFL